MHIKQNGWTQMAIINNCIVIGSYLKLNVKELDVKFVFCYSDGCPSPKGAFGSPKPWKEVDPSLVDLWILDKG